MRPILELIGRVVWLTPLRIALFALIGAGVLFTIQAGTCHGSSLRRFAVRNAIGFLVVLLATSIWSIFYFTGDEPGAALVRIALVIVSILSSTAIFALWPRLASENGGKCGDVNS